MWARKEAQAVAAVGPAPPPRWERINWTLPVVLGLRSLVRSFPLQDRFLHVRRPPLLRPGTAEGSRPERRLGSRRLRGKNGGVPSWAPPRGAGPYKGKLAGAPASGRFGDPGSSFRPTLPHIPEDGAGCVRGMGALGDRHAACTSATYPDALRLGPGVRVQAPALTSWVT